MLFFAMADGEDRVNFHIGYVQPFEVRDPVLTEQR